MPKILISGGTGLVGKHLCKILQDKGYEVAILSRRSQKESDIQTYAWSPGNNKLENEAIVGADYIIHLAGAGIGNKRWTAKRKQIIVDSRIQTGNLIYSQIEKQSNKLKAFISASATGYYGALTSDKIFTEKDLPANDFLGQTCSQWEQMADRFKDLGIRTVKIRTGIALTKQGGALSKMITPIKMGIGTTMGNGKQYLPWIHIDDLCAIYLKAIEDANMTGAYNAIAPEHTTNREFGQTLASIFKVWIWFPVIPALVLKVIFGKMSQILLKGSRVSPEKIMASGYTFLFPELKSALQELTQ